MHNVSDSFFEFVDGGFLHGDLTVWGGVFFVEISNHVVPMLDGSWDLQVRMFTVEIESASVFDIRLLRQAENGVGVFVACFAGFMSDLDFEVLLEDRSKVLVKSGRFNVTFVGQHELF